MPFWKKMFNKRQGVYYPRAVVQGKPVEWRVRKTSAKVWRYGIVVVSLQHENPQASQRCSNWGSFYFYTPWKIKEKSYYTSLTTK